MAAMVRVGTVTRVAVPRERQLVRARDLADTRYTEPLTVDDLASAAHMSKAHFSREFRRAFGETPYSYLLSRRLERAATLLRGTDYTVADICMRVGLSSVGSFTTSFTRAYGKTPTQYRASFPSAASLAMIPLCVLKAYGRPSNSTIGEDAV
jgi:AraC-like DNA-binding protein